MTLKYFLERVKNLPEDTVILAKGWDHSYINVGVSTIIAVRNKEGNRWEEYFGETRTPKELGSTLQNVIVIE